MIFVLTNLLSFYQNHKNLVNLRTTFDAMEFWNVKKHPNRPKVNKHYATHTYILRKTGKMKYNRDVRLRDIILPFAYWKYDEIIIHKSKLGEKQIMFKVKGLTTQNTWTLYYQNTQLPTGYVLISLFVDVVSLLNDFSVKIVKSATS